ncbi:hypothetical protein C8J57DRAFT_1348636, partial [Mycena rebaudengoi]
ANMGQTYGAMLIGGVFATFFQGILTVQVYVYYEAFPNDLRILKALVASIWILDTTHLILISQSVYHYLITSWGNDAALMVSITSLNIHLLFVSGATILCQAFFLFRIWLLSKKSWLLTGLLAAACLTSFGFHIAISASLSLAPTVHAFSLKRSVTIVVFSIGALGDTAIAALLVFYLRTGEWKSNYKSTTSVINRVIQYTVGTGASTSLVAVAIVVAHEVAPDGFIHIAIHFSLGRMYTNALLAALNSRKLSRNTLSGDSRTHSIANSGNPVVFAVDVSHATEPPSGEEYCLNNVKPPAV